MAFPDDLLELAQDLANLEPDNPRQASLRRAVSTAYYALFHLLISEATSNWNRVEQRPALSRAFDHGPMKSASVEKRSELESAFKKRPVPSPELTVMQHLYNVVATFVQAQQKRNDADYDNAKGWARTDVLTQIESVSVAFARWNVIREEPIAQEYLYCC